MYRFLILTVVVLAGSLLWIGMSAAENSDQLRKQIKQQEEVEQLIHQLEREANELQLSGKEEQAEQQRIVIHRLRGRLHPRPMWQPDRLQKPHEKARTKQGEERLRIQAEIEGVERELVAARRRHQEMRVKRFGTSSFRPGLPGMDIGIADIDEDGFGEGGLSDKFPLPDDPEIRDLAEKIEHLHRAAENLDQAGLPEEAQGLVEHAEEMERELERRIQEHQLRRQHEMQRREGDEQHDEHPLHEIREMIGQLHQEVRELRHEVGQLREILERK